MLLELAATCQPPNESQSGSKLESRARVACHRSARLSLVPLTGWRSPHRLPGGGGDGDGSARVVEVVDRVVADGYRIVDVDGLPTTAGPQVLPHFALDWLLVKARVTEDPGDQAFYEQQRAAQGPLLPIATFSATNHYLEYYGLHLSFMNLWSLIYLEEDAESRAYYQEWFERSLWGVVGNDRQALFDYMVLDALDLDDRDLVARVRQDLLDFQEPPERRITLPRDGLAFEVDPTWWVLKEIVALFDEDYAQKFEAVSREPFPIPYRCNDGFMWQRNPYVTECAGPDDPAYEYAPMDFLVAYWMGRWRGFLDADD